MQCKMCRLVELRLLQFTKDNKFEFQCPRCNEIYYATEEELEKVTDMVESGE